MKKLKVTIDLHTLACLVDGHKQMSETTRGLQVYERYNEDWCTATTQHIVDEMMEEIKSHPAFSQSFTLKLTTGQACALMYWIQFTSAIDSWTLSALCTLHDEALQYINASRTLRVTDKPPTSYLTI